MGSAELQGLGPILSGFLKSLAASVYETIAGPLLIDAAPLLSSGIPTPQAGRGWGEVYNERQSYWGGMYDKPFIS